MSKWLKCLLITLFTTFFIVTLSKQSFEKALTNIWIYLAFPFWNSVSHSWFLWVSSRDFFKRSFRYWWFTSHYCLGFQKLMIQSQGFPGRALCGPPRFWKLKVWSLSLWKLHVLILVNKRSVTKYHGLGIPLCYFHLTYWKGFMSIKQVNAKCPASGALFKEVSTV